MPSNNTGNPKVNRSAPLPGSRPTVAMASPMDMLNNAFIGELPTKLVIRHMPNTATMNNSGRTELQRELGERRDEHEPEDPDAAADERCQRGDDQSLAAAALAGHLVAVESGCDG